MKYIEEKKGSLGFTLIELLVVIAIIALLSSIVLASLANARAKARDARRVADLHNVQLALELYYDKNSSYMVSGSGWTGLGYGWLAGEGWGSYTAKSVARSLNEAGYLSDPYVDGPLTVPNVSFDYMIYLCDNAGVPSGTSQTALNYSLSATKEIPVASEIAYASTTCMGASRISSYGKNYMVANRTF